MTLISRLVFLKLKRTDLKFSEPIITKEISIVIPVKDNQHGIDNYLKEFFLTHDKRNYPKEIIIIDNNSSIPLSINVSHLKYGLPIILTRCLTPGPAAARNIGAVIAKGKWLLFNDSDCVPTRSLLFGYMLADNLSIAYAGNVKPMKQDKLSIYYESQEILIPLKIFDENDNYVPQYLITANSLIWKKAFDEVGGFNQKINIAGGEDIDLGLRLSQIGHLSYAFDSIVKHDFSDGLFGFCKRFMRYGKGNRIVEEIWGTNMKPIPFRPNEKTLLNEFYAKIQFIFLRFGYWKKNKEKKII